MNIRTLIIRFGVGTLVAASAAVSATDRPADRVTAEAAISSSHSVSSDIASRHELMVRENPEPMDMESDYNSGELQLAEELARRLDYQIERRLAEKLDSLI